MGELIRPYLIADPPHLRMSHALGTLAVERVFDGLFLALTCYVSLRIARDTYPHAYGVDPGVLQVMIRLEREHDAGRNTPAASLLHPEGSTLVIFFDNHYEDYWMARYHSAFPERVVAAYSNGDLERPLAHMPPGTRFLVGTGDFDSVLETHARQLEVVGPYGLWDLPQ